MTDLHSHVLWGLDDGARTVDHTRALIEQAIDSGTRTLVATPHNSPDYPWQAELVAERFAAAEAEFGARVHLHLGCDFHLTYDNIVDALANPSKYTIAGGPYLLVEFSDLAIFRSSDEDLKRLREAGMIPVVTHPERNPLLRQRLPQLARWVNEGCRLQVTGGSYLGRFGQKAERFAHELTEAGLVHFVASDAHHPVHRPATLHDVRAYLEEQYSPEVAEALLHTNPGAAVRGQDVAAPAAKRRRRGLLSFLRR